MGGGIIAGADADHQADELPPAEAQANAPEIGAARSAREASGAELHPGHLHRRSSSSSSSARLSRRVGGRRYRRRRGGGIDPWIVLWGLNELSRSRAAAAAGAAAAGGWWRRRRRRRWRRLLRRRRIVRRRRRIGGMVMLRLSEEDHAKVSAAIAAAEAQQRRRDHRGRDRRSATPITTSRCTGRCWCCSRCWPGPRPARPASTGGWTSASAAGGRSRRCASC